MPNKGKFDLKVSASCRTSGQIMTPGPNFATCIRSLFPVALQPGYHPHSQNTIKCRLFSLRKTIFVLGRVSWQETDAAYPAALILSKLQQKFCYRNRTNARYFSALIPFWKPTRRIVGFHIGKIITGRLARSGTRKKDQRKPHMVAPGATTCPIAGMKTAVGPRDTGDGWRFRTARAFWRLHRATVSAPGLYRSRQAFETVIEILGFLRASCKSCTIPYRQPIHWQS